MIDISEKDILDIIFELTHLKDEEGNDVPHFCFASDLVMDLDAKEEEIATIAAKNGYKIYKVFPGETMQGGLVLIAEGATIEPVEIMYKEFYGEVPEIDELSLNDDGILVSKEEEVKTEDLEIEEVPLPTKEEKFGDIETFIDGYKQLAHELGAEIEFFQDVGPLRKDSLWYSGIIAELRYWNYIIDIFADGDEPEYAFDNDDENVIGVEALEERGIYNDELFPDSDTYEYVSGPYIEFTIRKGEDGEKFTSYGDLEYDSMWDLDSALDIRSYIDDVIPTFEESGLVDDLEEGKNTKRIKVGDPNAKAMWGRTRHRVELPKKGKGSFKRHAKHRLSEEVIYLTPDDADVNELSSRLNAAGFTVESVKEHDEFEGAADIHMQVYSTNEFEHEQGETTHDIAHRLRPEITEKMNELADICNDFDEENNSKYRMTYSIGFGGTARDGTDCTARISAGIDLRAYMADIDPVDLDEGKKKNPLKAAAKKHAKTDKKGARGWFVFPNVEKNIQHFNHVSNGSAESTITAPAGLGEDIEPLDKYQFDFDPASVYASKGTKWNSDGSDWTDYWYTRIPETCMRVSRSDYKNNKLLKMPKNKAVLDGVEKFFNEHKKAKYCVIGCRDISHVSEFNDMGRFVNVWRVLLENPDGSLNESQSDYWVLSDGENPRNSNVYSSIPDIEDFIVTLEASKPRKYWELLHYVDGEPVVVWSTEREKAHISEDLSTEELENKIKEILNRSNDSDIHYLEFEPGTFVVEYDDEDVDFSTMEFNAEGSPRFSFTITGGLNGSGDWADYLEDLKDKFQELEDETGLRVYLEKLENDIADDVWTAQVFLFDSEDQLKDEIEYFNKNNTDIADEKSYREDIEFDVVKAPKSPSGVTFKAFPRDNFVHRSYFRSYPEFRMPANGKQIFKSEYKEGKYLLCKAAEKVVSKFFKDYPRNTFCVLLAYDKNGKTIYADKVFGIDIEEDTEVIDEAAEKHDTLNPKLWDEANNLKPEVREKILEIVKEFTDGLEEDEIKFKVDDIVLVGSNCSYNYNDKSDLDVHIRMDTDSLECPDDLYPLLYSAYRSLFNNKFDIDFYGIPVEIYVETSETEQMSDEPVTEARKQSALKSNGIFSVLNNEWIKEPVAEDIPEVDQEAFNKEFEKWEKRYLEIIGENSEEITEEKDEKTTYFYSGPLYRFDKLFRRNWSSETRAVSLKKAISNFNAKAKQELGFSYSASINIDPKFVSEAEYEPSDLVHDHVCPNCGRLLNDSGECPLCDLGDESVLDEDVNKDKIKDIEDFIEDIYDLRKDSIANEGEYGIGNLVFKECRNRGYLDNLKDLKNELKSKEFSLESLEEHLTYDEVQKKVKEITEEDVRSWINNDVGWDMTIDPDTLKKADASKMPSGWIVTQNLGLDNMFSPDNYAGMTAFIKAVLSKYGDKYYIGTYKMKYGKYRGKIAIDVNKVIKNTREAIIDGIKNSQESIYRFDEYLFLTHNLISRRTGLKRPDPLTRNDLKAYGLNKSIVDEPMEDCMNLELVTGPIHTNIPSVIKKK